MSIHHPQLLGCLPWNYSLDSPGTNTAARCCARNALWGPWSLALALTLTLVGQSQSQSHTLALALTLFILTLYIGQRPMHVDFLALVCDTQVRQSCECMSVGLHFI